MQDFSAVFVLLTLFCHSSCVRMTKKPITEKLNRFYLIYLQSCQFSLGDEQSVDENCKALSYFFSMPLSTLWLIRLSA